MKFAIRLSQAIPVCVLLSATGAGHARTSHRTPLGRGTVTCPVQLRSLTVHGDHIAYVFRNSTDKQIQGILFGLAYFDSVQDPHRVYVTGGDAKHLPAGQVRREILDIKYWKNSGYTGWTVWPSKILFADSSIWVMGSETTACSSTYWLDKQITPPPLPATVMAPPHDGPPPIQ